MTDDAENAVGKQRGRPFQPGQSGNPAGKAKGTRHRATMAVEALLDGQTNALTQKCIDMALAGDATAMRMCMDRIAPVRRDAPVSFDLPPIKTAAEVVEASTSVLAAMSSGEITPGEGAAIMGLLTAHRAIVETGDHEARLIALEERK